MLAIGLVVDDAIVVVEAVEHHIEHGLSPHDAALKAMEQVSAPVIAIALILSAVFVPTAFIPGITGRLYQQFAVTIAVSVIISAFNALTLSPALSAMLLRPRKEARGPLGAFFRWFNRAFGRATDGYVNGCHHLIRKSAVAMLLLAGIAVLAGLFGSRLPASFLPDEDQGYFYMNVQLPDAASLQRTNAVCKQIDALLKNTPGVQTFNTVVGFSLLSGVNTTYSGFYFVTLAPWEERDKEGRTAAVIMRELNEKLAYAARSAGVRLLTAGHSRGRHVGRRDLHARGPLRSGRRIPGQEHQRLPRGGAQAPGARHRVDDIHSQRAAGVRQGRPRQGAQAGRRAEQRVQDAADLPGRRPS